MNITTDYATRMIENRRNDGKLSTDPATGTVSVADDVLEDMLRRAHMLGYGAGIGIPADRAAQL